MSKATPSPWYYDPERIREHDSYFTVNIYSSDPAKDHEVHPAEARGETMAITKANANLIVAAHDLARESEANLAMLIELRDKHLSGAAAVVRALVQKRIDATQAAIAKAKGEPA